ncbi:MAG: hypothetical protein GY940_18865, partial [bacterium]|nr:hypothetical protein [bacterium]
SLRATFLSAKILKELEVKIPVSEIFKTPTIRGLSALIIPSQEEKFDPITPVEKKDFYPMSSAQNRLYVLHRLSPESTVYNMPRVIPLAESPDPGKFQALILQLIQRHESLRTSFHMVDDEPMQAVHDHVPFQLESRDKETSRQIASFARPFDLSKAPLLRLGLIPTGPGQCDLLIDMHHIISDGISHDILSRDFKALLNGQSLPPLNVQYRDFAVWRNSKHQRELIRQQENYWLEEFAGDIPVLNMATDYPRPEEFGFEGGRLFFRLEPVLTTKIRELISKYEVTLMMFLIAAFKVLLSIYTGQQEIVVGTVIAGRRHEDLNNIIGFFVNMLAIKTSPHHDKTFGRFLTEVKQKSIKAFDNQDYQFETLVHKLQLTRQPGRHPLIDAVFAMGEVRTAPGLNIRKEDSQEDPGVYNDSHFDLSFYAVDGVETIDLYIEYSVQLFKHDTIKNLSTYYTEIVEQVTGDQGIRLCDISVSHDLVTLKTEKVQDNPDDWGF